MGLPTGRTEESGTELIKDLDLGFSDLVRAHQNLVYSVALRVSGCRSDADDLTAETFLRAYRVLQGYGDDRLMALRPRPWLLTIMLNLWRNTARDRARRPAQVPLDQSGDVPAVEPSVEDLVVRAEDRRALAVLVARLPLAQRKAVVLRHVAGLSVSEIAEVLRCPEGTVKSHISRGLARLRAVGPAPAVGPVRAVSAVQAAGPVRAGGGRPEPPRSSPEMEGPTR